MRDTGTATECSPRRNTSTKTNIDQTNPSQCHQLPVASNAQAKDQTSQQEIMAQETLVYAVEGGEAQLTQESAQELQPSIETERIS